MEGSQERRRKRGRGKRPRTSLGVTRGGGCSQRCRQCSVLVQLGGEQVVGRWWWRWCVCVCMCCRGGGVMRVGSAGCCQRTHSLARAPRHRPAGRGCTQRLGQRDGRKGVCIFDHGLPVRVAAYHRADLCFYDRESGERYLVDLTIMCAAKLTRADGAPCGYHRRREKEKQHADQERHGSDNTRTTSLWEFNRAYP